MFLDKDNKEGICLQKKETTTILKMSFFFIKSFWEYVGYIYEMVIRLGDVTPLTTLYSWLTKLKID